jgi:hypothetical protein
MRMSLSRHVYSLVIFAVICLILYVGSYKLSQLSYQGFVVCAVFLLVVLEMVVGFALCLSRLHSIIAD